MPYLERSTRFDMCTDLTSFSIVQILSYAQRPVLFLWLISKLMPLTAQWKIWKVFVPHHLKVRNECFQDLMRLSLSLFIYSFCRYLAFYIVIYLVIFLIPRTIRSTRWISRQIPSWYQPRFRRTSPYFWPSFLGLRRHLSGFLLLFAFWVFPFFVSRPVVVHCIRGGQESLHLRTLLGIDHN